MLLASIWLLPQVVEGATAPRIHFNIPAGPLDESLTRFTEQSGMSVGMAGNLPHIRTHAVTGDYTAQEALQQLLSGIALEASQAGNSAYRLRERAAPSQPAVQRPVPAAVTVTDELTEVVVTAAKRQQSLHTVPISMTVINGAELDAPGLPGGSLAALPRDTAISSTNLGPGRNRQYIRGVADSPFLGPSQATVSVQFDEVRATYDGPDPDLRLIDVAQVEILKGPQGPLYGTGALGGVFRIVPRAAELDAFELKTGAQITAVADGATAGGADLMVNAPLVTGKAGVRIVAYANTEPGWIDNSDGRRDSNGTRVRGGRLDLRTVLPGEWQLDLQAVAQYATTHDSRYVTDAAEFPQRTGILPEPHDSDFRLASLTARGRVFGHQALVTASVVSHEADGELDASAAAASWALSAPLLYQDDRQYQLLNQELRWWSDPGPVEWMLGASHLSSHSDISGELRANDGAHNVLQLAQHVQEAALFGELVVPLPAQLRSTLGLRLFHSSIENEHASGAGAADSAVQMDTATPSIALDWRSTDEQQFVYLRYARAIRPGGPDLASGGGIGRRFAADKLSNVDLGARLRLPEGFSVQGAVFATRWLHLQSDYLLPNGLVGTRTAGDARNLGVEVLGAWTADHWQVETGATLQHARLHRAIGATPADSRLPVVPDQRIRASVVRSIAMAQWQLKLRAEVSRVGAARLSFEPALDRATPAHVALDGGISLHRGGFELNLHATNLLDSRADTFAYGNPFSIRDGGQRTPLQPRSVTLGVGYGW